MLTCLSLLAPSVLQKRFRDSSTSLLTNNHNVIIYKALCLINWGGVQRCKGKSCSEGLCTAIRLLSSIRCERWCYQVARISGRRVGMVEPRWIIVAWGESFNNIVELFKDFEQGGVGVINLVTPVQGRGYTSVQCTLNAFLLSGDSVLVLSPLGRTCHAIWCFFGEVLEEASSVSR